MADLQQNSVDEHQIEEGEIISTESSAQTADDQATVLTSLDELIKSHIASLDRLQVEKKKLQEMVADGLNNDVNFKGLSDKAKEAAKAKSQARQQIMNRPGIIEFVNKLKNITSEIKEKTFS